jgi:DNA-binding XRE family transcriptional regulator
MAKQRLSHVRAGLGLTQAELAELSGVSKQTIVDAEKRRSIRLITAYAILNALNGELSRRGQPGLQVDSLDWNVIGD